MLLSLILLIYRAVAEWMAGSHAATAQPGWDLGDIARAAFAGVVVEIVMAAGAMIAFAVVPRRRGAGARAARQDVASDESSDTG